MASNEALSDHGQPVFSPMSSVGKKPLGIAWKSTAAEREGAERDEEHQIAATYGAPQRPGIAVSDLVEAPFEGAQQEVALLVWSIGFSSRAHSMGVSVNDTKPEIRMAKVMTRRTR